MNYISKLNAMLVDELKGLELIQAKEAELESDIEIISSILDIFKEENYIQSLIDNKMRILLCFDTLGWNNDIYIEKFLNNISWLKKCNNKHEDIDTVMEKTDEIYHLKSILEDRKLQRKVELEKINGNSIRIKTIKTILTCLRHRQIIFNENLKFICDFLESEGINQYEKLHILESIKKNNVLIKSKINNNESLKYKDGILKIIEIGFEYYERIEIEKSKESKLVLKAQSLFDSWLLCYKLDDSLSFIQKNFSFDERVCDFMEYKAFYHIFMNKVEKEILDYIQLIQNKDFYFDKDNRMEILKESSKLIKIYSMSRNFFDKQIDDYELKQNTITKNEPYKNEMANHLLFVKRQNNTFFENDLKDVPPEYLEKVVFLLEGYRYNKLSRANIRKFTTSNKKFEAYLELRVDQVRIILKHLGKKYYAVNGISVKKDNIDLKLLEVLSSRPEILQIEIDDYKSTELEVFDRIIEYCQKTKRKGNR